MPELLLLHACCTPVQEGTWAVRHPNPSHGSCTQHTPPILLLCKPLPGPCCSPPTHRCHAADAQANEILHHKLTLNGYLAEFTGQSIEQITMDTDRDFFMSAQVRHLLPRAWGAP